MRIARLAVAALFALALLACSEGDGKSLSEEGGSGGSGTRFGREAAGVVDSPEPFDCGGVRVIEMESSVSAVLNDHTDTVDNWYGTCAPLLDPDRPGGRRKPGNDVIIHYVVPQAGLYEFSTEGSEFDTLLYVLRDCNDGFSESACNNDYRGIHSTVSVRGRGHGENLFIVVDSVGVRESMPFTLRVTRVGG